MREKTALEAFSDEKLAASAAGGVEGCFEELVCRYGLRLFRFLRPKTVSDQEAEDLVQETFRKAYQNIGSFNTNYRFSTWLYTIAHRLSISLFRSRRPTVAPPDLADASMGPEERLISRQETENIWALARNLQPRQFEALWLRYAEELSVGEIARVMRASSPHIRVLLHRGRLNLAKAYRQAEAEGYPETCRNFSLL